MSINILVLAGLGLVLLGLASRTYPFWIARIFGEDDSNPPPSVTHADGKDFVKTPTQIVFAHHFASIAGAGPIVGPIVALAFGWGPAWLWILIGGIFYGAVHDMTAMFVSLREGGRTIAEISRRVLGPAGYGLFLAFLLIVISLVNAIFLKLSASALSSAYPLDALGLGPDQTLLKVVERESGLYGRIGGIATTSVILMTLAAPWIGYLVAKKAWRGARIYLLATGICLLSVLAGFQWPVTIQPDQWMWILTAYVFVACWIPVWMILQPRDFMNVQILYAGLALMVVATFVGGFNGDTMQMDMNNIEEGTQSRGPFWPIMFITIACGAISGFHSLVSTGTTVKQLSRESDCRRVGYNAMILESFLAMLVLIAVGSQLSSQEYALNMAAKGGAIQTFAVSCGHLFHHLGIPLAIGCVLGILIIEGFLVTTLDTSIRLARYLLEELWQSWLGPKRGPLANPLVNTGIAVGLMLLFAFSQDAYSALWPFFGAGNQLIGALALTTVTLWLLKRGKRAWFTALPAAFMVVTAITAIAFLIEREWNKPHDPSWMKGVVVGSGILLLALSSGFVLVAILKIRSTARMALKQDRSDRSA